ncbi:uncharacterized protein LOC100166290 [Acyrthosiphon pisum]|uniref:HAUS augmin-like complex subunit 6 N-terminal domain-containing protein n=1 Tax=Acyrthosiphon pisum TaxID=7029 RepID=A0A8R1VYY6_ACYPI|nr:uncharacterized protein LOC100166290 [Acyrthosiphon pisum]|eukprot:XP_001944251.2 PREDICTED: uncharacterized protein LOC100166290 [Acyrthosiphon pisum]
MEAKISHHIQGISMLSRKTVPPALNKHLTNKIFNKPNKEAMEQVLYYLLPLTDPNCLKTVPWPITNFKEAAEFRNTATLLINGLDGFVYEKSTNVVSKVNSSLLSNPGGSVFIFFMYQFCLYIKCCEFKKKGIVFLNAPLYIEDKFIDKKISMLNGISNSNFNEVNEIISRVGCILKNSTEIAVKCKEIIQDRKQRIKDFKSALLNIEHCEATANEVSELKQKCNNLYANFQQNKLIALKCARLTDIILQTPETLDANILNLTFDINQEELMDNYGKVDLVKFLTTIKNTLNSYINWCEQLNEEGKMNTMVKESQQSVIDMAEQILSYEKHIEVLNNIVDNLKIENRVLHKEVFSSKSLENLDPRIQSVYKIIPPIILKTDFSDKPKLMTSKERNKSRRSILLHSSSQPYKYQTINVDTIRGVYNETLPNPIKEDNTQDEIVEENNELNETEDKILQSYDNESLQENSCATLENQPVFNTDIAIMIETEHKNGRKSQIKKDEIKSVSISRKSIENIKQKFIRIKKQAMSTIPHSPQSPL